MVLPLPLSGVLSRSGVNFHRCATKGPVQISAMQPAILPVAVCGVSFVQGNMHNQGARAQATRVVRGGHIGLHPARCFLGKVPEGIEERAAGFSCNWNVAGCITVGFTSFWPTVLGTQRVLDKTGFDDRDLIETTERLTAAVPAAIAPNGQTAPQNVHEPTTKYLLTAEVVDKPHQLTRRCHRNPPAGRRRPCRRALAYDHAAHSTGGASDAACADLNQQGKQSCSSG